MRILIIDVTRDYGLFSPLEKPMGGLQSGVCYLTRQLSLQGHELSIVNGCAEEHMEEGVRFIPWNAHWTGASEMDAIIVTAASSEMMAAWQHNYGRKPMWLLWVHYDIDQNAIHLLKKPEDRDRFDGFLFVSEWQTQVFRETFGIGWDRAFVMRNAVSPVFHDLFQPGEAILPAKSPDPLFVYTSTPYRGLEPLMNAVPLIRERVPDARFQIFSSWAVYGRSGEADPHHDLYERCRTTPGVEYIGGVPQTQLAQHMKQAWGLAYPSIFRETSCIAVMEGLAAGCKVITSHLAALPETTGGFGELIINPADDADLSRRIADRVVRVVDDFRNRPAEIERELQASVEHARTMLTWSLRASQLAEWLSARHTLFLRAQNDPATKRVPLPGNRQLVQGRHGVFVTDENCLVSKVLAMTGQWLDSSLSVAGGVLAPGDTVIEIGAHIGGLTVPLAKAVGETGKLYAFEAQPDFARRLQANLELNALTQVELRSQLVGDGGAYALVPFTSVPLVGVERAWGQLVPLEEGTQSVPVDAVLPKLESCRLVKISAPGIADKVLNGMLRLVSRTRPLLLIEINSDGEYLALRERLLALGYYLHWQCSDLFAANNAFQAPVEDMPPLAVLHLLAIPAGAGLFSQQHPALFLRDPEHLFPGKNMLFRKTGQGEQLDVPPQADLLALSGQDQALTDKWRSSSLLVAHLTYVLAHGYGGGTLTDQAFWAELLAGLMSDGAEPPTLLAMGDDMVAVSALWALLAKSWGREIKIDLSATDGFPSQSAMDRLGLLVWILALEQGQFCYVTGTSLHDWSGRYDVIFSRSISEAELTAPLLKPAGLLVLQGAEPPAALAGLARVAAFANYGIYAGDEPTEKRKQGE